MDCSLRMEQVEEFAKDLMDMDFVAKMEEALGFPWPWQLLKEFDFEWSLGNWADLATESSRKNLEILWTLEQISAASSNFPAEDLPSRIGSDKSLAMSKPDKADDKIAGRDTHNSDNWN